MCPRTSIVTCDILNKALPTPRSSPCRSSRTASTRIYPPGPQIPAGQAGHVGPTWSQHRKRDSDGPACGRRAERLGRPVAGRDVPGVEHWHQATRTTCTATGTARPGNYANTARPRPRRLPPRWLSVQANGPLALLRPAAPRIDIVKKINGDAPHADAHLAPTWRSASWSTGPTTSPTPAMCRSASVDGHRRPGRASSPAPRPPWLSARRSTCTAVRPATAGPVREHRHGNAASGGVDS